MESQAKLNEKYMSFGTLYFKFWRYFFKKFFLKKYKIQLVYQFLYFLLFYIVSAFTSADIISYNFLEPYLQHFLKKIFVMNFHFLTDSSNPPPPPTHPLNG